MPPEPVQDQYVRIGNFCIDHELRYQFSSDAEDEAEDLWPDCNLIEAREDQDDLVAVVAVPRSTELCGQIHTVTIRVNESTSIWSAQCDCRARRGCGHVVAALIHIEHDSGAAMEVVDAPDDIHGTR